MRYPRLIWISIAMKNEKDIFLPEPADWNYKYLIDVTHGYLCVSCLLEVRDLGLRMGIPRQLARSGYRARVTKFAIVI